MPWTLRQLADAVGGRIDPRSGQAGEEGGDGTFGPLTIDSREVVAGAVFVPIVADRDGHAFVGAAVEAGAGAYLYMPGHYVPGSHMPGSHMPGSNMTGRNMTGRRPQGAGGEAAAIAVADTGVALLDLGRAARRRIDGPVVGITGSVGKTSTKDLTAATVGAGRRVTASARSFNNELGVPLTLANAPDDTEVAVIEMGARGIGHIALLCDVARPTMAVVTAVAAVHTEMFRDLDAVATAKGELVEALPAGGTAVLNGDDPRVAAMAARTEAEVLRYGVLASPPAGRLDALASPPAWRLDGLASPSAGRLDVVAESVELDDELRARYVLRSPWGSAAVVLPVRGAHQVGNSLAALAVALRLGVDLDAAVAGLAGAAASRWRMELGTTAGGARILNDAYNANPTSVAAALAGLARLPASRRVAVLGAMAELGPDGPAEHRRIAGMASGLGIELVVVGTADYGVEPVADIDGAIAALGPLSAGDAVLVKASRVVELERLADRLLEGGG